MKQTTINAQIVAHSVNEQGDELISVLATFPRIILAEVNTHRMLSKNTSSSRAIPFNKMVETIENDPFIPIAWQKEHKGMQGTEYWEDPLQILSCKNTWEMAKARAIVSAETLNQLAVTKQLCNRLLEPFMWTTMLITGPKSGWDNFFNLRCPSYEGEDDRGNPMSFKSKKDALRELQGKGVDITNLLKSTDLEWLKINKGQAEIHMMALAECIWDAYNESTPKQLKTGEWHIPFVDKMDFMKLGGASAGYYNNGGKLLTPSSSAVAVSVAMAARTSYTIVGEEKAIDYEAMIALHDRLLAWDPPHSSPLEHCARTMSEQEDFHFTKTRPAYSEEEKAKGNEVVDFGWCNNFKGFIPYRYMVDNGNQETKN
jgi:hypothetical protein